MPPEGAGVRFSRLLIGKARAGYLFRVALFLLILPLPALAQQGLAIHPRVSATETITDNAVVSANGARQSDYITQLSAGVRVESTLGQSTTYVDYMLTHSVYGKRSSANQTTSNLSNLNNLNTFGTYEAIDNWLYIDYSAYAGLQNISAFAPQTAGITTTVSANSTETANFRVAPRIRGNLASFATYDGQLSRTVTRSKSDLVAGAVADDFAFNLRSIEVLSGFGWTANASSQSATYGGGTTNSASRLSASLNYRFGPEFRVIANSGIDFNNFFSASQQSTSTSGYGAEWNPSERTSFSALKEQRFFGNAHAISINHRMPLSAIRFIDTRSLSMLPPQYAAVGRGTYYDLLYAQLATSIPDPLARAQQVATQLQQAGIPPTAAVTAGFQPSTATISRRQELSLVINGLRNTVTYTAFQSDQESIGAGAGVANDFSTSSRVKQRGMNFSFSHRLSERASIYALSSWINSQGSSGQSATTQVFNLNASTSLGRGTSATMGLRTTRTDGTTPYRENALLANVTTQF